MMGILADGASDDSGQYFTTHYCSDEIPMVEGYRQGCLSSAFHGPLIWAC